MIFTIYGAIIHGVVLGNARARKHVRGAPDNVVVTHARIFFLFVLSNYYTLSLVDIQHILKKYFVVIPE